MSEPVKEWDYCQIEFQLRYKGEDMTRSGTKQIWLVFLARAVGPHQKHLAGEAEIPIAGNVAGASFVPKKNIAGHVNIHQNLLRELQEDGWELLPERGSAWWERRLRRSARPKKSLTGWLKRK